MNAPTSLKKEVSPPPRKRQYKESDHEERKKDVIPQASASLAAVEAGEIDITDHLEYFSRHLEAARRRPKDAPNLLGIPSFRELYQKSMHQHGRHFVIHQHDHPIAGTHYDLRLQFSETSSLSFSIPYGVPGNPNSIRPNRRAIETRVHNVWNNLIESASHATGSLLIWDTGEYEVLPYYQDVNQDSSDTDGSSPDESNKTEDLAKAFSNRHIRLRLHGHRLPHNYTVALRLPTMNNRNKQPRKPKRRRRRTEPKPDDSDSGEGPTEEDISAALASDAAPDETIRKNNAYTGASNTIGSIHQRNWFLTLDRVSSGFVKARQGPDKGRWIRARQEDGSLSGFGTFFIRGRDHERSIVTARLAQDILADEGVKMYMGRKMWIPITE